MNAPEQPPPSAAEVAAPFAGARWLDVHPRFQCLPYLDANVLLHAGPPFRGAPPAPVRQAAIQAMLFEKLAPDAATARAMLASGVVRLEAAQDHRVVTPLAQVVSHTMPMAVVGDGEARAFAPLSEGPAPALRFGAMDPACLERLQAVSDAASAMAACLRAAPVDMGAVIRRALEQGDECHARTAAANAALLDAMPAVGEPARGLIAANPGFALPVMMAAACWALRVRKAPVVMAGGNGVEFGFRLRGADAWRHSPADAPVGTRFPAHADTAALSAIGDSAVLDFCGLGGQAIAFAPALLQEWSKSLPADAARRRLDIVDPASGAVDPARVRAAGRMPIVHLAILDASGAAGLIGRGFYIPPPDIFSE